MQRDGQRPPDLTDRVQVQAMRPHHQEEVEDAERSRDEDLRHGEEAGSLAHFLTIFHVVDDCALVSSSVFKNSAIMQLIKPKLPMKSPMQ